MYGADLRIVVWTLKLAPLRITTRTVCSSGCRPFL